MNHVWDVGSDQLWNLLSFLVSVHVQRWEFAHLFAVGRFKFFWVIIAKWNCLAVEFWIFAVKVWIISALLIFKCFAVLVLICRPLEYLERPCRLLSFGVPLLSLLMSVRMANHWLSLIDRKVPRITSFVILLFECMIVQEKIFVIEVLSKIVLVLLWRFKIPVNLIAVRLLVKLISLRVKVWLVSEFVFL